jgi:hypothetical protein
MATQRELDLIRAAAGGDLDRVIKLLGRQRFERRAVPLFEQAGAGGIGPLAEGTVIQPIEQFADRFVEVCY